MNDYDQFNPTNVPSPPFVQPLEPAAAPTPNAPQDVPLETSSSPSYFVPNPAEERPAVCPMDTEARRPYAPVSPTAPTPSAPPAPYVPQATSSQYAYGQGNIAPQPIAPRPPVPGGFANEGAQYSSGSDGSSAPRKKPRRAGKFLGGVAMLLACAVAGFGGGMAANVYVGQNGPAVIYRAAKPSTANPVGSIDTPLSLTDVAATASESFVSVNVKQAVTDTFMGQQEVQGSGSGVIISENGYIITNDHVVEDAAAIQVVLPDGSIHDAKLIGTDPTTDIAVIKINVSGLTPAVLGNSDNLILAEPVLAIGNPTGTLGGTVTNGIISALNREIHIGTTSMNLLQFSAAVSPGNSGGGLFNMQGHLVGIVNAKSSGNNTEGIGFAIPINTASRVAEELMEQGFVSRPGMGVMVVQKVEGESSPMTDAYTTPGVYIHEVTSGGAADKAGIKTGDRVLSADGIPVMINSDLTGVINQKKVGDTLQLEVERNGEMVTISLVLEQKAA